MKSIYFQLVGGAAGDMLLCSLIGLGCPLSYLKKELKKLNLNFEISLNKIKGNHNSKQVLDFKGSYDFSYKEIVTLIKKSRLSADIKENAIKTYELLFKIEKTIHRVNGNDFKFHHLGKLDAILEICGFYIALKFLKIDKKYVSIFPLAHPAEATLAILKNKKVSLVDYDYETITPTASALLSNLEQYDCGFTFEKTSTAFGKCGEKDYLVAYLVNESPGVEQDKMIKIETNIDDMNPQIFESLFEILYKNGAKEVYLEQVLMKKTRPGFVLNVLCLKKDFIAIRDIIFSHTSTFGIRYQEYLREKLKYKFIYKQTKFGKIRFRVAQKPFAKETPEYADCLLVAKKHNISLIEVYKNI